MSAHSVLNVRAAPEWGNSELYKYYERNGLGYGTVQVVSYWPTKLITCLFFRKVQALQLCYHGEESHC